MRLGLSIASLLFIVGLAGAETFDQYVSDIRILQAKPVQKELGVTEAQRAKMNEAAGKNQAYLQQLETEYRGQQMTPELQKKIQPGLAAAGKSLKVGVLAQLTAAQTKRLREITLQRASWSGLADERVAKEVGMSSGKLKDYRAALQEGAQKALSVTREAVGPVVKKYQAMKPKDAAEAASLRQKAREEAQAAQKAVAPQIKAIDAATKQKLQSLLTSAEISKYKALQGKPFRP
jgi:hypothetical protein